MKDQLFRDENILVTGASRGIGAATALALAEHGANVAVHYNKEADAAADVVERIHEMDRKAIAVQADLSLEHLPKGFVAEIERGLGQIERLVLNAGSAFVETFEYQETEDWDLLMHTNLRGSMLVCRAFLPAMVRCRKGSVVLVSSEAGVQGFPGMTAYGASKSGLCGFGRSLALETAPNGIRVNIVSPGLIDTDLVGPVLTPSAKDQILHQTPLGRIGRPEEVAAAVVFLLSDSAAFITGQTLAVNGGIYR